MSKKEPRKAAGMALKSMAGRQDWNGIKPITRVIPNKKKAPPTRNAKHKGRHFDAGLSFFGPLPNTGKLNGLHATTFPEDQERFSDMFP